MKVRDGMWTMADGLLAEYAEEVYSITPIEDGVQLLCPTKKVFTRGDTLNVATITMVGERSIFRPITWLLTPIVDYQSRDRRRALC